MDIIFFYNWILAPLFFTLAAIPWWWAINNDGPKLKRKRIIAYLIAILLIMFGAIFGGITYEIA